MKKCISPIILILIVFLVLPTYLTGCRDNFRYYGDHVDLNTVAINSILGIHSGDRRIFVIDEDSYGRRVFVVWGDTVVAEERLGESSARVFAVLISQQTKGKYVYFYPDYNVLLFENTQPKGTIPTEESVKKYFGSDDFSEDIKWLKGKNDWEKPLDESKSVRVKVSRYSKHDEKRNGLVSDYDFRKAREQLFAGLTTDRGAFYYLTSDNYNRHIFFTRNIDENDVYTKSFVVMFNKDGSFDPVNGVMEITDLWNYQDDLKAFRERNGWNTKPPKN